MNPFTKRKFLNFSKQQQHKKCAELLNEIYLKKIADGNADDDVDNFNEISRWINEPELSSITLQELSDCYHNHLTKAKICYKEHHLLPNIRKRDSNVGADPWPISIYLDHIRSAHNVGSILRTVEAFSLGKIYFSDQTPYIDHKQVQDTSMGTYEWVSCEKGTPLKELIGPIIVLETSEDAIPINEFLFPKTFTLVLGNEEYGCSENSLQLADYIVEIPLRGRKNSLNVANAFAIVAATINFQKTREQ